MNQIELSFDHRLTGLAGNDYGYMECKKQINPFIALNNINEIIFPAHIERIADSFIQGLKGGLLEKVSKQQVAEYIIISSSSIGLTAKIITTLKD